MIFDPDQYLTEPASAFDPSSYLGDDNAIAKGCGRVAIVGMAGRFPGAADIEQFWKNLREGRESITFFPESEMELPPWVTADTRDPKYVRAAGVLEQSECFDTAVFGVTRREAEYMDPQQRVFLELCWAALENAGYNPKATGRLTGVFAGTVPSTYLWLMLWDGIVSGPTERLLATVGTLPDNLTTRAAYKLNLRGPAVTVQTACSSSLVAVNTACQSLLDGKCDMALAGGVAIVYPQKTGYLHNPDLIESVDGHCRAFSKGSTGAVFSNGGAVVALKRLEDAVRDGDFIHAVIAGSAVNNDGNDKIGYTAPSVSGQAGVIRAALDQAGVNPDTVGFVEAHGTGTPLGDPIEIAALSEVYGPREAGKESRAIGSVKTNIGHLNAAAGVASLIKAALALRHGEIPPSLHYVEANPELNLHNTSFQVNAELRPWPPNGSIRRAAVSSFGIGGTNAHAILEEAPCQPQQPSPPAGEWHVIALSGVDKAALETRVRELQVWLGNTSELPRMGDLAFTLNTGRFHFGRRAAFLTRNTTELGRLLEAFLGNARTPGAFTSLDETSLDRSTIRFEEFPQFGGAGASHFGDEPLPELALLAKKYTRGEELDWTSFYKPGVFRRTPLPIYPFKREKIWFQGRAKSAAKDATRELPAVASASPDDANYRKQFSSNDAMLADHRVGDMPVLAGAFHLEMARAAGEAAGQRPVGALANIYWVKPFTVTGSQTEAIARLSPIGQGFKYELRGLASGTETIHSFGEIRFDSPKTNPGKSRPWLEEFKSTASMWVSSDELYARFARSGINYGPSFRVISKLWTRGDEVIAELASSNQANLTRDPAETSAALLDGAFQSCAGLFFQMGLPGTTAFVPYSIEKIEFCRPLPDAVTVVAVCKEFPEGGDFCRFDLDLIGADGAVCVRVNDLCLKKWATQAARGNSPLDESGAEAPMPQIGIKPPLPEPVVDSRVTLALIEERVLRHMASILKVSESEIDPDTSHADYGVDSLLAVEIIKSLNDEFGTNLRATELFSHGTIRQLSRHLSTLPSFAGTTGTTVTRNAPAESKAVTPRPEEDVPVPQPALQPGDLLAGTERRVIRHMASLLKVQESEIDPDASHADYGVDSLLAVEIIKSLNDEFGTSLRATDLFSHGSIRQLSRHLLTLPALASTVAPSASVPARAAENAAPKPVTSRSENIEPGHESDDIAVIGLAGRFPDAENCGEFWQNLKNGRSSITEIPRDRWDSAAMFDPNPLAENKSTSKWGGFLRREDEFDSLFFNLSPKEAAMMDPQQRLFLEEAWHALEDAGYPAPKLDETRCGVFVGVGAGDYWQKIDEKAVPLSAYTFTGNAASILAARIAYLLNLKGPAIALDTACSSSLVAVHLACQSICSGDSDIALAGGVFIMNTPRFYLLATKAGMLSTDGACRAFDQSANGMVPGEGVGVIVLKRLGKALADRDRIYGVIKGSAVNQDGKTNSITAPSSASQTRLEVEAYRRAGVNPANISLVEAHGTGTRLGDPIELHALADAFGKGVARKQFCAIGSVKTNIGHLMTAAGIAGLIKVLLCLRHGQIPPSLNFRKPNEHFDFSQSPFFVNTGLREWTRGDGPPRAAAVSSFGFSGTNAHVVLCEAPQSVVRDNRDSAPPRLFCLSARCRESLETRVRDLEKWLVGSEASLDDLAYTLNCRRSHFDRRVAVVAANKSELVSALRAVLDGEIRPNCLTTDQQAASAFPSSESLTQRTKALVSQICVARNSGKAETRQTLIELGRAYVHGAGIDWNILSATRESRCLTLPGYPFLRQRCGFDLERITAPAVKSSTAAILHPLVHSQVDVNGSETVFRSELAASEPVLSAHRVAGHSLLPGAASIEIARAATELAGGRKVRRILNAYWLAPVKPVGNNCPMRIRVSTAIDPASCEIESGPDGGKATFRSQISFSASGGLEEGAPVDFSQIRERTSRRWTTKGLYEILRDHGLDYGDWFQRVRNLQASDQESLAEINLTTAQENDGFELHPALLDAAFQSTAAIGYAPGKESGAVWLPFSIDAVELLRPCGPKVFVHARLAGSSQDGGWRRYDMTILDAQGIPAVRVTNYCLRRTQHAPTPQPLQIRDAARNAGDAKPPSLPVPEANIFYRPDWVPGEKSVSDAKIQDSLQVVLVFRGTRDLGLTRLLRQTHAGSRVISVVLGRRFRSMTANAFAINQKRPEDWAKLKALLPAANTIYFLGGLVPRDKAPACLNELDQAQERGVMALFRLAKSLDLQTTDGRSVLLKIVTNDLQLVHSTDVVGSPASASLIGFGKTLAREVPGIAVSCVDIAQKDLSSRDARLSIARALAVETPVEPGEEIALRRGRRHARSLTPMPLPEARSGPLPFRQGGVYLFVGGASGIALEIARHLAKGYRAKLVLIGRKALEGARAQQIKALEDAGAEVLYFAGDGADQAMMDAAVKEAKARFGAIHGVLHSAVVLKDAAIWRMDETTFHAALDPKVRAGWVLYQATRREPLDFFVFFSSVGALFGNPGQSNYAAGCSFEDALGRYARQQTKLPVRVINWGFWGDIGIVATESYRNRISKEGILPFTREEGLVAWETALSSPEPQIVAVKLDASTKARVLAHASRQETTSMAKPEQRTARVFANIQSRFDEIGRSEATLTATNLAALDSFARRLMFEELSRSSEWPKPGQITSVAELQARIHTVPACAKLFHAVIDALVRGQFARRDGDRLEMQAAPPGSQNASAFERELLGRVPGFKPFVALLKACLPSILGVIRGEIDPVEVLFPKGSTEAVSGVYRDNAGAQAYNLNLASVVAAQVAEAGPLGSNDDAFRLLEIGAGTGSASEVVLGALAPYEDWLIYDYTDISPTMTRLGQRKFGGHKFIRFKTLDVEGNLSAQGFQEEQYDTVIASGVLHATRRIRETVRQARGLLKPGGLLVLNEPTQRSDFATLTFGLTPGWWLYEDETFRQAHSPLLAPDQWTSLLAEEGFTDSAALGVNGVGQSLIVGFRGGDIQPEREPSRTFQTSSEAPANPPLAQPGSGEGVFFERTARFIWGVIARVLKVSPREFDRGVNAITFDRYGIDSLGTLELTAQLEKHFGSLPKTLFFEHANLAGLTAYFIRHHHAALAEIIGEPESAREPGASETSGRQVLDKRPEGSDARETPPSSADHSHPEIRQIKPVAITTAKLPMDIAVIGMSGRYPMADTLDEFWDNLKTGRDCFTEVPADRWDWDNHPETKSNGGVYCKRGAFVRDMDKFDPLFFNISPREAELMDPQDRLFLQTAWEAMEDAGYTRQRLSFPSANPAERQRVGVFVGVMHSSYQLFGAEAWANGRFVNAGSGFWCLANRVSYGFDLQGPSLAVDTACSASLTAIHLACESLRNGESEMAFAGGVNLILHPTRYLQLCQVKMLSQDGVCRPFGEGATGFVSGEGVGVLLLKPLAAALRDGDQIHGLIKGSSVNSGGKTNGFSVPNPGAQASLIQSALTSAGLEARDINYVEAHGTGTSLGDPVEFAGLSEAFKDARIGRQSRALGSVKSNIGHLESAAGIASVTKVLLMMKHRQLAPSLHAQKPNPLIDFQNSPFRLQQTVEEWRSEAPLRAGVSSFGAGGSNAHVILEEHRQPNEIRSRSPRQEIVVLSAQNRERLEASARRLADFLEKAPAPGFELGDVAYSLQTGREAMDERLAVIAGDIPRLVAALRLYPRHSETTTELLTGNARTLIARGAAALQNSEPERAFVRALHSSGQLVKLASFWVSGSEIDWQALHHGDGSRRISLPTYPFARDRYWIPEAVAPIAPPEISSLTRTVRLHPLIDANVSTLSEIRFRRDFTPEDDFLRDHVVRGQPVLPGAAQLEMARAAAEIAGGMPVAALANIVWMRPIIVNDGSLSVFTSLSYHREKLQFEIWTESSGKKTVHSQGKIEFEQSSPEPKPLEPRAVSVNGSQISVGRAELYRDFALAGLAYGERFRVIDDICADGEEARATLQLPQIWVELGENWWHPALVDGAFQSIAGLAGSADGNRIHLPFSIGRIETRHPLRRTCQTLVRESHSPGGPSGVRKFDIYLADSSGRILMELHECSFREIPVQRQPVAPATGANGGVSALEGMLLQLERGEISCEEAEQMTRLVRRENGALH